MTISRRNAVRGAATTALLAAARATLPHGALAQGTVPEVRGARLGYVALTDAAPLIVAREKGLFARYGLPEVEILKQPSWGATRDNLALNAGEARIDGAHILTPMAYLMHAGRAGLASGEPLPMAVLARLNTNGQAISVQRGHMLSGVRLDASPLRKFLTPETKVAMTFTGGTHDLWLRYWLAAAGIDPTRSVRSIVVPPPRMVMEMGVRTMDAFCAGEPWNAYRLSRDTGFTACVTGEIWRDHPEKSLAMRADWVQRHPHAATALTAAVIEAQRWCDDPANHEEMATILARPDWIGLPLRHILPRARGDIDYGDGRKVEDSPLRIKFWRDYASYPFRSHDLWFLAEEIRWGLLPTGTNIKALVEAVNREGLWRAAAERAGVPADETPSGTSRGRETFFDGKVFDPEDPGAYIASPKIQSPAGRS
jgi:nitrate/nitrite transport system substrate-binding protein